MEQENVLSLLDFLEFGKSQKLKTKIRLIGQRIKYLGTIVFSIILKHFINVTKKRPQDKNNIIKT